MFFSSLIRPLIFKLNPESAHDFAINALSKNLIYTQAQSLAAQHIINNKKLNISRVGLNFANPLGLAAGFDKNGEAICGIAKLGFGSIEIGTVTPQPQKGNAKPRLFRLVKEESIINRMGFNNDGAAKIYKNLQKNIVQCSTIVGVNIGANKNTENKINDYIENIQKFYDVANYLTINISSPNTPGLRDLQQKDSLNSLIKKITQTRIEQKEKNNKHIPIFLKIAPDLDDTQLEEIAQIFLASDLECLIVSNTTIARDGVENNITSHEEGGLSGKALFYKSNKILAKMRKLLGAETLIIGVGGVDNSESFIEKIKAGADLVQLYTGMVYQGPTIVYNILFDVLKIMENENIAHISDYRDMNLNKWLED